MATITTSPGQTRALELNILARKQRSLWRDAWFRLRRNRAAMVGLGVVAVFVVIAILAPFLAPRDPIQQTTANALADPFWGSPQYTNPEYPLGSDQLGRDILSRLIWSTRVSLWVGFIPVSLIFLIGVSVGMLAEATLSFFGIGIKPPTPTWGVMINEGFVVFSTTPWPVLLPALCISTVMLAFTFVGDGLRDALDPRMKT